MKTSRYIFAALGIGVGTGILLLVILVVSTFCVAALIKKHVCQSRREPEEQGPTNPTEQGPTNPTEQGPTNPTEQGPTNPTEQGRLYLAEEEGRVMHFYCTPI